jgi:hypothetical protein
MRGWRAVLVLAVVVLSPSCGGSTEIATDEAPTTVVTSIAPSETSTTRRVSTTPGPPQTPLTGPLTTPPTVRPVDDYLPAGVPDQIFPPGTAAYQLLKDGQCGPLLRQITSGEAPAAAPWRSGGVPQTLTDLYTAAANACLANWAPAQAAFLRVATGKLCEPDPNDPTNLLPAYSSGFQTVAACQETRLRVYRWTERLLKAHNADRAFVPNFPTPPKR